MKSINNTSLKCIVNLLPHLLAAVEQPLPLWLHLKELKDFDTQLIHLGQFGQGIHPMGFLPIHCAHLNPHCSCPV